ncbi:hypothetical protein [Nostoc sp. CCY 9925]|uniref:hypothetical protein n=1 Tax=Nostoc sp. CCY 9925 TaxID=3103865 RepID=UPI0039C5F3AF
MTTATLQFIDDKITEKNSLLEEIEQLDREIKAAQEIEFDLTSALESISNIFNRANPIILDEVKKAIAVKCSELGILSSNNVEIKSEPKKVKKSNKKDNGLTKNLDKIDELLDKSKIFPLSQDDLKDFNQSLEVAANKLSEDLPADQVEEFKNNLISELESKSVAAVEVLEPEIKVSNWNKVDELLEKNKVSPLSSEDLNEFGRSLDAALEEVDKNHTQQELDDSVQAIADIQISAEVVAVDPTPIDPVVEPVVETKPQPQPFSMTAFFNQPIKVSEAAIATDDMKFDAEPVGTIPVQMESIKSALEPVVFYGNKSVIPVSELQVLPLGTKLKHRSGTLSETVDPSEMPADAKKASPQSIIPIKFIDNILDNWYSWQKPEHLTILTDEQVQQHLAEEEAKLNELATSDPF